jgi:sugar lactone lactonase YvrE
LLSTFGTIGKNEGEFSLPTSINFDSEGNFYISEVNNNRVQIFNPAGKYLGEVGAGLVRMPHGLAFDSFGALYITDAGNNLIRKFQRN